MNRSQKAIMVVALLAASAAGMVVAQTGTPTSKRSSVAAWTEEGLQKVESKGLDAVYSRPGASLGGYTKVRLQPISVAFRRGWERQARAMSNLKISTADAQRIKDRLSALVQEEMVKQLQAGGYQVVETAGDDVLDVKLSIVDLYIVAPDVPSTTNKTVYALSAGEMTLIAELRDSPTGDILARVFDRKSDESNWAKRITHIDNEMEARSAAVAWATALRVALDNAGAPGAASTQGD